MVNPEKLGSQEITPPGCPWEITVSRIKPPFLDGGCRSVDFTSEGEGINRKERQQNL